MKSISFQPQMCDFPLFFLKTTINFFRHSTKTHRAVPCAVGFL